MTIESAIAIGSGAAIVALIRETQSVMWLASKPRQRSCVQSDRGIIARSP